MIDAGTLYSGASAIGGLAAGWFVGKKTARSEIVGSTADTMSILATQVETLKTEVDLSKEREATKDAQIADLNGRVTTLSNLVTQRAEVAEVKAVVDKIARKLEVE